MRAPVRRSSTPLTWLRLHDREHGLLHRQAVGKHVFGLAYGDLRIADIQYRREELAMAIRRLLCASAAAAVVLVAASCTSATPYQPYRPEFAGGVHGGFSEQRLAPDRFLVRFHGNELTSRDRVEGYLLYRAAELTVQNGHDWFAIIDRHTEHDVETHVRPDPFYRPWYGPGYGYWHPEWRYYRRGYGWGVWHPGVSGPFWADRVDVSTVESFEATAEIVMHNGPVPAADQRTFDARRVLTDLGPTIVLPRRS